ncbi:vacuolar amino acid transporter-like protein 1, partial [Aureobasidium melanogenum]
MPAERAPIPSNWTEYERGGRRGSSETLESHIQWGADVHDAPEHAAGSPDAHHTQALRHRRSSMSMKINTLRQAGGVNSIDNFARSWQRAAGFYEIAPVRPSFRVSETDEESVRASDDYERQDIATSFGEQRGLLRQALADGRKLSDHAISDAGEPSEAGTIRGRAQEADDSIFQVEPQLTTPFSGSYGTNYGSLSSRVNESSMRHAGRLFQKQQLSGVNDPDKEREPLLVKQVEEDDGKIVNVVVGQSTLPQTIFNSVNVLIGVGLLALPLAMKYAGWVCGLAFFAFAAASTRYTAKLLAKCLDVDNSLITFADLAYVSFGSKARIATSLLFSLELIATCVALVVLFADSLNALIPGWGLLEWKIVCGFILIPLSFLPLRLLSFTSILGIVSCFGIVLCVVIDGFIKPHTPGSLREPAKTYLFPENWATLPLSLGLLMSPWGGHSVFPNIYRDMRHPYKYNRGLNITYAFTATLDLFMAVVGLLMFGDAVKDEISSNILADDGYPQWLSVVIVVCVAMIPLAKIPLNARPIVSTLEILLGLDARAVSNSTSLHGMSGLNRGILKAIIRILCTVVFVVLGILVPEFDRIMSLLGSVACFTICIILPLAFHLKIFGDSIPRSERIMNWVLIIISSILAIVGTAFNFIPRSVLGIEE